MEFKDRLRLLREDKQKSAAQLAGEFEKSEGAIRMWETGKSKPDADTLIKLAHYFDCTTDYLLGLSDFRGAAEEDAYTKQMESLFGFYEELRGEYKVEFIEIAKQIMVSFFAINNDDINRNKELFTEYIYFLGYFAAFYNTQFGLYAPPYFEHAPKTEDEALGTALVTAFEIIDGIQQLAKDIAGLQETDEAEQQFLIDFERYKAFISRLNKEETP